MRLLWFNSVICKNIVDMMPGIKATYQMEQEFAPYLDIAFLKQNQHNEKKSGIILQTKDKEIKKYYTFKNAQDIEDLRQLIWVNLTKERNMIQVDKIDQNNDRYKKPDTVIQGWHNLVDEHKTHIYPNISQEILPLDNTPSIRSLKKVFRLNPNDKQTEDTCKTMRYQECFDNYPRESPNFKQCIDEVNWLCHNGYPNVKLGLSNKYINKVWEDNYKYLNDNNGIVNKQKFDDIINSGMFYDTGVRSGNKSITGYDRNFDGIKYDKAKMFPGIDVLNSNTYETEYFDADVDDKNKYLMCIFSVLLIIVIYYFYKKKIEY